MSFGDVFAGNTALCGVALNIMKITNGDEKALYLIKEISVLSVFRANVVEI